MLARNLLHCSKTKIIHAFCYPMVINVEETVLHQIPIVICQRVGYEFVKVYAVHTKVPPRLSAQ